MWSKSVAVKLIVFGIVNFLAVVSGTESEHETSKNKPTVTMSILFLIIPVVIGLSVVSVLARRMYLVCSKKVQPESPAIREIGEEFSTSLDTTDSFEEVRFADMQELPVSWNPFQQKSYANIETKTDTDPLEEMEARFVLRKQNQPIPLRMTPALQTHKALHDFSRVSAQPESASLYMASTHLGQAIRV